MLIKIILQKQTLNKTSMKKTLMFTAALLLATVFMYGGGIVTNTNQSASWVRMPARDASLNIDAVYFNPAGLTKMENGFHLSLNSQTIFQNKDVTSTYLFLNPNPKTFEGNVTAPVFPGVYAAWKKDKIAVSFGFNPIGGGGGAEYEKGLPVFESQFANIIPMLQMSLTPLDAALAAGYTFDPQFRNLTDYSADIYFKGSSVFFGYQLGFTYQVNELISGFVGGRLVTAKNTYTGHIRDVEIVAAPNALGSPALYNLTAGNYTPGNYLRGVAQAAGVPLVNAAILNGTAAVLDGLTGDMEVDAEESGMGFTPIIGLNLFLNEKLNIGLKYEFKTKLELETTVNDNKGAGMFYQDSIVHSDMPAMLSAGVQYKIISNLTASAGVHYYFDKNANYGKTLDATGELVANDKVIDNNYFEVALGLEYAIGEKLVVSGGFLHANTGVSDDYQSDLSYSLTSNTVGLGLGYKITDKLMINLGGAYTVYQDGNKTQIDATTGESYTNTYLKDALIIGIGIDFRF
ncbi:MAG: outer membrane protein transport protein [Bacteroidales bacterium]